MSEFGCAAHRLLTRPKRLALRWQSRMVQSTEADRSSVGRLALPAEVVLGGSWDQRRREVCVRKAVVALALLAVVAASCANAPTTSSKGTGSTSTSVSSTSVSSTTRPPSALDALTRFFTATAGIDQNLKAAAVEANGAIGTTQITITQHMLDTIAAADPTLAADDIPAGLPSEVLLRVLTAQSDLVSRYYAFRGFVEAQPGTIPRTNPTPDSMSAADYLLTCLGSGGEAASSYPADVAAARSAASNAPPLTPVGPSSQAAADLAIWLHDIVEANSGCASCGGARFTSLPPITWHHVAPLTPGGNAWDGDMAGLLFTAQYAPGQGWTVQVNAC